MKAAQPIADTVNAATLGRVLGISRATIANLATDGILPRADRGLFSLPACAQAYIRHKLLQAGAADVATKSLVTERSRLARFKADQAEREGKKEAGELVPAADVEAAWLAVAGTVRTRILLVPRKIAPRVVTATTIEAERLMQRELNAALAEIAATPTI